MQSYIFSIAIIFLTFSGSGGWAWSLFGPKNYDQCIEAGLKDVNNDKTLNMLISRCYLEFKGSRTAYTGLFDKDLLACGVTEPAYEFWLPAKHRHTVSITRKLTERKMRIQGFPRFSFQNNSTIPIRELRIALVKKGKKCSEYSKVFSFGGSTVEPGEYGDLIHTRAIDFEGFLYCVQTVKPPAISSIYVDKAELYGYLKTHKYCGN